MLTDEKRRQRLLALTDMMLEWMADDWDQPAVHETRRAVGGYRESEQQIFASTVRGDLGELRRLLAATLAEPDAVDSLMADLASLRDGQKDDLGRILEMAENALAFLRVERLRLHSALQDLVIAHYKKGYSNACTMAPLWAKARKALKTGAFDFVKGRPK